MSIASGDTILASHHTASHNADGTMKNGVVSEATLTLSDNTTADVSTTKHGLVPKAPNDTTKFLRGDATWAESVLTGEIKIWATDSAPSGWLFCNGVAVSRTTYAALFAVIGATFGAGDGSTTFNTPDLRGRVPVGSDDMGTSAASRVTTAGSGVDGATLGASGGAQNVTLDTTMIPSHSHTYTAISGSGQIASSPGDGTASSSTGSTGGGLAHNNMQPSLIINYIIKT